MTSRRLQIVRNLDVSPVNSPVEGVETKSVPKTRLLDGTQYGNKAYVLLTNKAVLRMKIFP